MVRKKTENPPSDDQLERLTDAVEKIGEEMNVIRKILDTLLDDFQWALNNDKFRPASERIFTNPYVPLTSMSLDPLAKDFRINRTKPEDLPPELSAPPAPLSPPKKRKQRGLLFDADDES